MKITLLALDIENFKGIQAYGEVFDGNDVTISAENGVGKTTVYDAFLWLLFGKNSEGKTAFGVRPVDKDKQPVPGLTVMVRACLDIDGHGVILEKRNIEKPAKKQVIKGFESEYEIEGVPKLKKEFDAFVAEMIAEEKFRALTDLNYFNNLLWADQRMILMELADEIGIPTGFDELLKVTSGKKLKDVETVAKREKKGYEKEQAEINPRIDEIEKGCKGYATEVNTKEIDGKRNAVKMKIGQLDSKRAKLFGAEKERQQTIETINTLKRQQIERESALASDTSGVVGLVQEKAEMQTALNGINSDIQQQQISLASYVGDRDRALKRLNGIVSVRDQADVDIAAKVAKLTEAIENVVDTCPTCDRPLDESKIAEAIEAVKAQIETAKAKSKESIEAIQHDGNEAVADIKLAKTSIENVEAVIQNLSAKLEKTEAANADRIKEIDRLIHRNEPPAKENDNEWKVFALKIQGFEEKLGDSVADVLQGIDTERIGLLEEVAAYDMTLASGDRLAADKKRIDDYKAREKELAQLIADIDNRLEQIDQYGKAESELIEKAVNDKFKHVEFKLFKEFQNGEVEPYCVATYKGVSYPDLSTGQRIYIGVDIINVLSDHFDISVVLFIDHSESLTMPIEANSQVIKLQAAEGVKELVTVAT